MLGRRSEGGMRQGGTQKQSSRKLLRLSDFERKPNEWKYDGTQGAWGLKSELPVKETSQATLKRQIQPKTKKMRGLALSVF